MGKATRLFAEQFRNIPGLKAPDPKGWWIKLSRTDKLRWSRYLFVSTCTNGLIWGTSILYLALAKPVYTSSWALILPGSANAVNLSLPEIGQATASNESLGLATFDPRANYEYIFVSEQVIARAAKIANIPKADFAKPRIKNIDNTTLMQIDATGPSPVDARKRAYALHDAIVERLNELRVSEIEQRKVQHRRFCLKHSRSLRLLKSKFPHTSASLASLLQNRLKSCRQILNSYANKEPNLLLYNRRLRVDCRS
ncbi:MULTISPECIES: hypothetical protein [unclassified Cyanobium]|uniref:hypothetical protein n=1 Tax=unclassified Cyanobium TaxID=2627006 RepID=UPI0020CCF0E9|nr:MULTISPECIES: hypothetical protein [unclassified Cyanobium]MCP9834543.1 hypothetical protein [Cyanobium sp. La Preciosa 7G6]